MVQHRILCSSLPQVFNCSTARMEHMRGGQTAYCTFFNKTLAIYACLHNFHYKSGDMIRHCEPSNGTWSGEEPVCELDLFKSRHVVSFFIVTGCLLVSVILICVDFNIITQRKRIIRREYARVISLAALNKISLQRSRPSWWGPQDTSSCDRSSTVSKKSISDSLKSQNFAFCRDNDLLQQIGLARIGGRLRKPKL